MISVYFEYVIPAGFRELSRSSLFELRWTKICVFGELELSRFDSKLIELTLS